MKPISKLDIVRYSGREKSNESTYMPVEALFTLYLNDTEILTFMASPEKLQELAVGFLRSAGVVKRKEEIKKLLVNERDGLIWIEISDSIEIIKKLLNRRFLTSGCGGGSMLEDPLGALSLAPMTSGPTITPGEAGKIVKGLLSEAKLYGQSGGLHAAALSSPSKIFFLAEDIGRHNAVDKVLGAALLSKTATADKILAITGRVSSEMLVKAARSQVAIVLSRTSPTDLAVKLAKKLNITVAGYARGEAINIYSHNYRINP